MSTTEQDPLARKLADILEAWKNAPTMPNRYVALRDLWQLIQLDRVEQRIEEWSHISTDQDGTLLYDDWRPDYLVIKFKDERLAELESQKNQLTGGEDGQRN